MVNLGMVVLSALSGGLLVGVSPATYWQPMVAVGASVGILTGLGRILSIRRDSAIQPVETLRWAWVKAKEGWISKMLRGGVAGLLFVGVTFGLEEWLWQLEGVRESEIAAEKFRHIQRLSMEWDDILQMAITFGLLIGAPFGGLLGVISGGFVQRDIEARVIPNQGIRRSLQNALLLGLGGGIAFVISIAMAVSLDFLIDHTIELEKRFGEATYEGSVRNSVCERSG